MLRLICHRKVDGQKRGMLKLMQAVRAVHHLTMRKDNRLNEYQGYSQANIEVCAAISIKIGRYEATADIVLEEYGTSVEKVKAEAVECDKIMLEMAEAAIAVKVKTKKGKDAKAAATQL